MEQQEARCEIPNSPISGPEIWRASDLREDQSWIRHFSEQHLQEMHEAVESVKRRGLKIYEFTRRDFPLPTLRLIIKRTIRDLEHGKGITLLRGLDVDAYSNEDLACLYWGLGLHLGKAIPQNARGDLIGFIRDNGDRSLTEKNVRGYATNDRLPPHTDPSDAVALLCVHAARSGGKTAFASAGAIFNEIQREHPEYLPHLFHGFHYDLRGEGVTDDPDEVTWHPVPVFSWYAGRLSCRFNRNTIIRGQIKAGRPLEGDELAAVEYVAYLAQNPDFHVSMLFAPGDIQLLCNHSLIHFREEFEDGACATEKRKLLRLWFNLDHRYSRPLEPLFANRHNTGPRNGIMIRTDHSGWVP